MQVTPEKTTAQKDSEGLRAEVKTQELKSKDGLVAVKSRFGEININPERPITFPHGLLGIPDNLRFYLADYPADNREQFKILQSGQDEDLSFIVIPTDYDNKLLEQSDMDEACEILEINKDNLIILLVVSVHRTPEKTSISVNLRAPIFVDAHNRTATQYVFQNDKYDIRHVVA